MNASSQNFTKIPRGGRPHQTAQALQISQRILPSIFYRPSGEEGQYSNKLVIKAKSQATAKKVQQLNQKQMQALALMFFNDECLKGRSVVLKRCEDRKLFTQELYSWKEVQRRKNVNLKGASPSGIMNTLCKLKKVERAHDNTIIGRGHTFTL